MSGEPGTTRNQMISTPRAAADAWRAPDTESATWLVGCSGEAGTLRYRPGLRSPLGTWLSPLRCSRPSRKPARSVVTAYQRLVLRQVHSHARSGSSADSARLRRSRAGAGAQGRGQARVPGDGPPSVRECPHRQGHPKIDPNRCAETISGTRPASGGVPAPFRSGTKGPGRSLPGPASSDPCITTGPAGACFISVTTTPWAFP